MHDRNSDAALQAAILDFDLIPADHTADDERWLVTRTAETCGGCPLGIDDGTMVDALSREAARYEAIGSGRARMVAAHLRELADECRFLHAETPDELDARRDCILDEDDR